MLGLLATFIVPHYFCFKQKLLKTPIRTLMSEITNVLNCIFSVFLNRHSFVGGDFGKSHLSLETRARLRDKPDKDKNYMNQTSHVDATYKVP